MEHVPSQPIPAPSHCLSTLSPQGTTKRHTWPLDTRGAQEAPSCTKWQEFGVPESSVSKSANTTSEQKWKRHSNWETGEAMWN